MKNIIKKIILALGLFALEDPNELPVCIVGAGPAGLTTAAELELKGKIVGVLNSTLTKP